MLVSRHWTGKSRRDAVLLTSHRFPDVGDAEH